MLLISIPARAKPWLIGIASGIVAIAIAYGVGWFQGHSEVDEVKAERETALSSAKTADVRVARLESRRRLHLAIIALDERNFGIAQRELEAAAKSLQAAAPAAGSELDKLKTELQNARLVATEDLGTQRTRIMGWAMRLDKLL